MFSSNDFEYIPTCSDCKHADLYIPHWGYPFTNPKCMIQKKTIHPEDIACENFELIGRRSR